jgi:Domain of unknown function (DUF1905)/Bacteriocin-protection, YdeI or OmpD-Associated
MLFRATLRLDGKTATGIRVPEEVVHALAGGNRPRVRVSLGGHSYQTTVARMRGEFLFPVSATVRQQAGVSAGDQVDVEIELDTAPRELSVPADLADALERDLRAREAFDRLSYSNRKRHVLAIESAKTDETRQRRLTKTLEELRPQAA